MKKKTTKKKAKPNFDLFYTIFAGELIEMVTEVEQKRMTQSEDEIVEQINPVTLRGYLLDMDEEHYFLGHDPDSVSFCIKKEKVLYTQLVDESSLLDDVLDEMPEPDDEEGYN